jgi:tRNA(Ile2) C34 agmatinyltransferase TiaS
VAAPHDSLSCPHCRKTFEAALLGAGTDRAGYKCPHCRLFVPVTRVEEPDAEAEAAA